MTAQELADFFTDALIDSTGPDWTCTDGAWGIVSQLRIEGRLERVLRVFDADPCLEALTEQEAAEDARNLCPECAGEGPWEHCGECSVRFGHAIVSRRSALAKTNIEQVSA